MVLTCEREPPVTMGALENCLRSTKRLVAPAGFGMLMMTLALAAVLVFPVTRVKETTRDRLQLNIDCHS